MISGSTMMVTGHWFVFPGQGIDVFIAEINQNRGNDELKCLAQNCSWLCQVAHNIHIQQLQYFQWDAIFSWDQAALWMIQSVRPSVCPSFCLSHLFNYVITIISSYIFQGLLPMTGVMSMQKVKVRGQRSRSQRSKPNFAISGPWLITILNPHMMTKWYTKLDVAKERCPIDFQGHPSNLKVTRLKRSLILTQIWRFRTVTPVWIHQ